MADLDGDGVRDVVAASSVTQEVVAVLGTNGPAGPDVEVRAPAGPVPVATAVAYVDDDEHLDVIELSRGGGEVAVHLGEERAQVWGLAPRQAFAAGEDAAELILLDLPAEITVPVVAVLAKGEPAVAILRGDGQGGFGPPTLHSLPAGPHDLVASDGDGDGADDLATTHEDADAISVLFGRGDGRFEPPAQIALAQTCDGPVSIAAARLDADEHPDAIVACAGASRLAILPGTGDREDLLNTARPLLPLQDTVATRVRTADVDHDGIPDLLFSLEDPAPTLTVLYGQGDAAFGDRLDIPAPWDITHFSLQPPAADGPPDLLTSLGAVVDLHEGRRIGCPAPPAD